MNVRKFQLELAKAIIRSSSILTYEDVYRIAKENSIQIAKIVENAEKTKLEKQMLEEMKKHGRNSTSSSRPETKN